MIEDGLMCNFFLFWMGQESFKDMWNMLFEGFLLKYLDNLFSLEYEGHIKIKR